MDTEGVSDWYSEYATSGRFGLGLLVITGIYILAGRVYGTYRRLVNNQIRSKKTQENAQSIEDLAERLRRDPLTSDRVDYIQKLILADLCKELKDGKIRPIEALKAYQTKALEAHRKTNCLVEVITEAEEWALQLEKGPREGALWGVPISIKDDIGIKGYDSAIGMVVKIGKPLPDDAIVLKAVRKEGAIPFVKTNVPQTEFSFEPGNPINGVVHNPHRHGYGPGGSSSGEGALIGSAASILGIGSDIGGSIRLPSHFCGVYGFKPTSERVSMRGVGFDKELMLPIRGTWGPMSREMDGLVAILKVWWKDGALAKSDPECVPIDFDTNMYTSEKKLRIGYYVDGGLSPTFSACSRAVEKAKTILANLGHEVVPWSPPDPERTLQLLLQTYSSDGGEGLVSALKYDKIAPSMEPLTRPAFLPVWFKKLLSFILKPFDPKTAFALQASCGNGSVSSNYEMIYEIWKQRRVVQDSWNAAGLDAVICPPNPMVSPPLGNAELLVQTAIFTTTYNLLSFPAGVIPVTRVNQVDIDQLQDDFPTGSKLNNKMKEAMTDTKDLPVGVMVAGQKYHDEMALRVMKILDEALKKDE